MPRRNSKAIYVEPDDAGYKIRWGNSPRSIGSFDRQSEAIDAAKQREPEGGVHVARVRHVEGGHPDQFRRA